ncbi:MAG: Rnase Y domain-containing protein, partial [Bacteroidota bacterium]|nr:Rnase Y domain-containing protein [Bacteroidota bacterium]
METYIIIIFTGVIIGVGIGTFIQRRNNIKQFNDANAESNEILSQARREADQIKSEKMLQAKERFIELKSE